MAEDSRSQRAFEYIWGCPDRASGYQKMLYLQNTLVIRVSVPSRTMLSGGKELIPCQHGTRGNDGSTDGVRASDEEYSRLIVRVDLANRGGIVTSSLIVSIIAVTIAALSFAMTYWLIPRREARRESLRIQEETISATLESTLSEAIASARNTIGSGVRNGPGKTVPLRKASRESKDRTLEANKYLLNMRSETIGAAFTSMWHLELVHLRIARVANDHDSVSRDIVSLYHHVDLMARELKSLLLKWGKLIDADDTAREVNKALERLPILIDESTGDEVHPTPVRLPTKEIK